MANQTPLGIQGDKRFPSHPRAPYYFDQARSTVAGGLPKRRETSFQLATDDDGHAEGYLTFPVESGFDLLQVNCTVASRLRLYALEADLEADRLRDEDTKPTALTPCLLDITFGADVSTASFRLFDQGVEGGIHCFNRDNPAQNKIYFLYDVDPESFIDGFVVATFYAGGTLLSGLDEGTPASRAYGWAYTPADDPEPYGPTGPLGWDRYWVSYLEGPIGIRSRSNMTTSPTSSSIYPPDLIVHGDDIWQVSAFKHDPFLPPNATTNWVHYHTYFRDAGSGDPRGCVLIGLRKYAYGVGVPEIVWCDSSGVLQVLDSDGTPVDVSTYTQIISSVIGKTAKLYINGDTTPICTGTVPDPIFNSGRRQTGFYLDSDPQPDFAHQYGGLTVIYWGVRMGDAPAISLTCGYVPREEAGGKVEIPGVTAPD